MHGRDGHTLDLRLKQDCQRRFEETHSREEFMAIIGRNYLLDEAEERKPQTPADKRKSAAVSHYKRRGRQA